MVAQASRSDLLILAFPLFADSLPAAVIAALEILSDNSRKTVSPKPQRLVAIVNNGFPEAWQNAIAVQICKRFADESGLVWSGGFSLGGGGAINGTPLDRAGARARNARKALDMAAEDLLEEGAVSKRAIDLMAKPSIPKWLYLWMSNRGWKQQAKACVAEEKLYNKL
jgi:hypothetical protein